MNYSYLLTETTRDRSWVQDLFVVLGASIIIALFAPISIHLPFTPVPIATQSHVVLLLAVLLGSRRSAMAVIAYLGQGAMGLPVFSGATGGILHLAGPTGGYLLGYVVAAYITGWLVENAAKRTPGRALLAMGVGNLAIYLFGLSWLSQFVGLGSAVTLGMLPFLVGDCLKLLAGVRILKSTPFYRG
jgi:biotin transport system substrate-specific component